MWSPRDLVRMGGLDDQMGTWLAERAGTDQDEFVLGRVRRGDLGAQTLSYLRAQEQEMAARFPGLPNDYLTKAHKSKAAIERGDADKDSMAQRMVVAKDKSPDTTLVDKIAYSCEGILTVRESVLFASHWLRDRATIVTSFVADVCGCVGVGITTACSVRPVYGSDQGRVGYGGGGAL